MLKVIDFGLAVTQIIRGEMATGDSHATSLLGSPGYSSPEQLLGTPGQSLTRVLSDVYSLGAVLTELVCGSPPMTMSEFESWRDKGADPNYFRNEIPWPSQRLAAAADSKQIARVRACDLRQLNAALTHELDWIARKATSFDPKDRYPSVDALAEDIRRFLDDNPIEARANTLAYRSVKFYRRNRPIVIASSFMLAAILAGSVTSLVMAVKANRAQHRAEAELATSTAVSNFFTDELLGLQSTIAGMVTQPIPNTERSYISVLINASDKADAFDQQPQVAIKLHRLLAIGFVNLSLPESQAIELADKHVRRFKDLSVHLYGHDSAQTLEAESLQLKLEEITSNDAEKVLASHRRLIERYLQICGKSSSETVTAIQNLGSILVELKRLDEAAQELAQAKKLAAEQKLLPYDPVSLSIENTLALLDFEKGNRTQSIERLQCAWQLGKERLGYQENVTRTIANNLSVFLEEDKKFDAAIGVLKELIAGKKQHIGTMCESTQKSIENLGRAYINANRLGEAIECLSEAIRIMKVLGGGEHTQVQSGQFALGAAMLRSSRGAEAATVLKELFDVRSRLYGSEDVRTRNAQRMYAESLLMSGKPQEALPLCEQLWSFTSKARPEQRKWAHYHIMSQLAAARLATEGVTEDALELAELAWQALDKSPSPDFSEVQFFLAKRVSDTLAASPNTELVDRWKARTNNSPN